MLPDVFAQERNRREQKDEEEGEEPDEGWREVVELIELWSAMQIDWLDRDRQAGRCQCVDDGVRQRAVERAENRTGGVGLRSLQGHLNRLF